MARTRYLGYTFGLLTAFCWATSPIFIRRGLEGGLPSPLWGVTVGLTAATCIYLIWLAVRQVRGGNGRFQWRQLAPEMRAALVFQALAGVAASLGTVGRVVSIDLAPVVVAVSLTQTSSLFTLIFAPLFLGQQLERVTFKLALGAVCVFAGSVLVIIGQNV